METELSLTGLTLLQVLREAGPLHVGALASCVSERLGRPVSRAIASRLLSAMQRKRLVIGTRGASSPHGGPRKLIYRLTSTGERFLEQQLHIAQRSYERLLFPRRLSEKAVRSLQQPPAGSAIAAARDHGIDLTLLAKSATTSPEDRFDEALNPELLLEALDDAEVDYVIVGGLAGMIRGVSRLTKHLDIAYSPKPGNCRKLAGALLIDLDRLRREGVLQLDTTAGRIDLFDTIAGFSKYNAVRAASSPVPLHGRVRNVLTRAGLMKTKQTLRRRKDESDLLELRALEELEQL